MFKKVDKSLYKMRWYGKYDKIQIKLIGMKTQCLKWKITLGRITNRLDTAEVRDARQSNRALQHETKKRYHGKKGKKQRTGELGDNTKWTNICIIEVLEEGGNNKNIWRNNSSIWWN